MNLVISGLLHIYVSDPVGETRLVVVVVDPVIAVVGCVASFASVVGWVEVDHCYSVVVVAVVESVAGLVVGGVVAVGSVVHGNAVVDCVDFEVAVVGAELEYVVVVLESVVGVGFEEVVVGAAVADVVVGDVAGVAVAAADDGAVVVAGSVVVADAVVAVPTSVVALESVVVGLVVVGFVAVVFVEVAAVFAVVATVGFAAVASEVGFDVVEAVGESVEGFADYFAVAVKKR